MGHYFLDIQYYLCGKSYLQRYIELEFYFRGSARPCLRMRQLLGASPLRPPRLSRRLGAVLRGATVQGMQQVIHLYQ